MNLPLESLSYRNNTNKKSVSRAYNINKTKIFKEEIRPLSTSDLILFARA